MAFFPCVSVFVPHSAHTSGSRSEAVIFPPHCCGSGLSQLLRRTVVDHVVNPGSQESPILEAPAHVSGRALRLCVEYLEHFSPQSFGDAASPTLAGPPSRSADDGEESAAAEGGAKHPYPTVLPEPLNGPIENLLDSWENTFIAMKLLGNNGDAWEHRDLMLTLRAAQFLEMTTLESMCLAWCGSQTLRICNMTNNCFEAAELLRKFFNVANDWTPEEEECLRIENEWPEGEA